VLKLLEQIPVIGPTIIHAIVGGANITIDATQGGINLVVDGAQLLVIRGLVNAVQFILTGNA
jgi:hypothetical protein